MNIILEMLTITKSWNPHAKFLIYMDRLAMNWEYLTNYFIHELFKYLVINVTLMIPDPVNYTQRILTWYPYDANNCGREERNFVYIGECMFGEILPKSAIIFPDKIPLNMNGCPVKIKMVAWPPYTIQPISISNAHEGLSSLEGVEIDLIRTIGIHANFTAQFTSFKEPENWGIIFSNGSGTGLMKSLMMQEAEIAVGKLTPTLERHKAFDFTIQYMEV